MNLEHIAGCIGCRYSIISYHIIYFECMQHAISGLGMDDGIGITLLDEISMKTVAEMIMMYIMIYYKYILAHQSSSGSSMSWGALLGPGATTLRHNKALPWKAIEVTTASK